MPKNWKTYKLGDFAEINPRVSLKQGQKYSFVEMKDLDASLKYVSPSTKKELKGGSKFQDEDTLFARITPCLENGKICQVKNLEHGIGFGSTEFMIFRGKEKVSNTDFVYYLTRTDYLRNNAIQAMTGTSGRQRVEKSSLAELEILAPDLKTQSRIASILSSLDDKIELNLQMNKTLEEMAQAIFKEWFVDFKVNGKKLKLNTKTGLPEGWRSLKLTELLDTVSSTHKFEKGKAIFLNTSDILEGSILHNNYSDASLLPGQAKKSIQYGDILFTEIRPANKRYAFVDFSPEDYVVSTKLMVLRSKGILDSMLIYFYIKSEEVLRQLQQLAESRSGTFPQITFTELSKISMIVPTPELCESLTDYLLSLHKKIKENRNQSASLTQLRNNLLPKLMSGKLEIKT